MTTPAQINAITSLVQAFLPRKFYGRAKAIVAAVLSVASAVLVLLPLISGVPPVVGSVVGVVIAVLTPLGVYLTGNEDAHDPEHDAGPDATGDATAPQSAF